MKKFGVLDAKDFVVIPSVVRLGVLDAQDLVVTSVAPIVLQT